MTNEPLRLFGSPVLESGDGGSVALLPQRHFQALAYLACRAAWVTRAELADWLWPEHEPEAARRNLRKVLASAREVVGSGLQVQGDCLRWQVASDLARFDAAAAAGRDEDMLAASDAPLMQGLEAGLSARARDWLASERMRLQHRWREAAMRQLERLHGHPAAAAELARRALAREPCDDDAAIALASALHAQGDRHGALRTLDDHSKRLADEVGLQPCAALRAARAAIEADATAQSAGRPAAVAMAQPQARPATAARSAEFVGRGLELLQLLDLVQRPACRILTITGPGGIGKTSLARHALDRLAGRFAHGAHWVHTGGLDAAGQIVQRWASEIGLALEGDRDPCDQLADFLAGRETLGVVDGAEDLADLAPLVQRLARECPRLKLLLTSRQRLAVEGEWLLPLEGLPLPDDDERDVDLLRSFDAVRLFEQRALAAAPGFDLAAQAGDVVRLLHALAGLPLAIELAAAWARLLPVAQIVREVQCSVELLGQAGTAGQTGLRESFAHSWRRLDAQERAALAGLAALPDACSLEMARQVLGVRLPTIAALADKSLLASHGDGRLALHPLVRQCVAELSPDQEWVLRAHAGFVARWLQRLADSEDPAGWRELDRDLAHARGAWGWAISHREPDVVARAARALWEYFRNRGLLAEGLALVAAATEAFPPEASDAGAAACNALRYLAAFRYSHGELPAAEQCARRGLRLAQRLRDSRAILFSTNMLGLSLWERGAYAQSRRYFTQALRHAVAHGDELFRSVLTANLAMVEMALGDYGKALALYAEALLGERGRRALASVAETLNNIGITQRALGRHDEARASLEEALALSEQHALHAVRASVLVSLGIVALDAGDPDGARRWLDRAVAGDPTEVGKLNAADPHLWLGVLDMDAGDLDRAADRLADALAIVRETDSPVIALNWLAVFARWCLRAGEVGDAAAALRAADAHGGLSALDREDALRRVDPRELAALAAVRPAQPPADSLPELLSWASERLRRAPRGRRESRRGRAGS
ncbi:MAG: tetratricopeptide repeat protein [Burkholderiales bacterium]|nr:tetratricopeptide repeat protein [Burkholderiales bacterium]